MRVLIVKLSSMGDVIQTLPAVTDASRALPEVHFEWAVDEAFAEIPLWHSAIQGGIVSSHRRWKSTPNKSTFAEIRKYWSELRDHDYDIIIDAQGNLKSALVTRLAKGVKHGMDKHSSRETGAQLAYHRHYAVPQNQLAIDRWRTLFAKALNYERPSTPADYGLSNRKFEMNDALLHKVLSHMTLSQSVPDAEAHAHSALNNGYFVYVHNASWQSKRWAHAHWRELVLLASKCGKTVLLPWGSTQEREDAERIAVNLGNAYVLPKLDLSSLAAILKRSEGAICMDTGLAHLSAALAVPTLTVYGPTNAALIGATGRLSEHLIASDSFECMPCYKRQCHYRQSPQSTAACLHDVSPAQVWQKFSLLAGK